MDMYVGYFMHESECHPLKKTTFKLRLKFHLRINRFNT